MRFLIYGVGAIGGTIAAQLVFGGQSVVGIARGKQFEAIRENGLVLQTPLQRRTAQFPVVADLSQIKIEADDVILLTVKGQDTLDALNQLKTAGVTDQPVFCFQNGVANERLALRFFENVYGATVMMPAELHKPGEVWAYFTPNPGAFDIGRFPNGFDALAGQICDVFEASGFMTSRRDDVMGSKYRKLLVNLNNIIGTAVSDEQVQKDWYRRARAEAETVLNAAGIVWDQTDAPARDVLKTAKIQGLESSGSSTFQSIQRGTGSIETDYLNGEIALLARLHGVAAPVNSAFCRLSVDLLIGRMQPRSVSDETIRSLVGS
jgi:2-dehydropantoate 2-reductase